ncbi:Pre-rRNA-processing protein fhl1 [Malassezia yamatoensis]|uniref:Pre-rRNA-processing protein fhl1 n=1 Tax=Malassezia yamatoensis TaxID=253288 RepID=A0AAJ5YTS5_9BASI|nr:Pre-rRNA-processing protein fhl1 [Malassezia yamatoensis]
MSATIASLPASHNRKDGDAAHTSGAPERSSLHPSPMARADGWSSASSEEQEISTESQHEAPICAYAKLEFPGFSYYVQTLEVTIGRRPGQLVNSATGAPFSMAPLSYNHRDVDVDLGPLKSISRLHARIFYSAQPLHTRNLTSFSPMSSTSVTPNHASGSAQSSYPAQDEQPEGRFFLEVLGRNGAFVDDVWVRKNGIAPLDRRTKIQIAERVFYFVLPPPVHLDEKDSEFSDASAEAANSGVEETHSSSSELSDIDMEATPLANTPSINDAVSKYALKARSKVASPARKHTTKRPPQDLAQGESLAKRRRPADAPSAPLPVGTPIGIEALKPPRGKTNGKDHGKGKEKAKGRTNSKENDWQASLRRSPSLDSLQEKGKSQAKGSTEEPIEIVDEDAEEESSQAAKPINITSNVPPLNPSSSISALIAAATSQSTNAAMVDASEYEKPELSNLELISNALRSETATRNGGKLTLQEVYEWLQHTYPWFAKNGRKTGRDWQSSIRHTIGTSREFVKIPRRPDEHGKGIFYTLSTSEVAKAHETLRSSLPPSSVPEKSSSTSSTAFSQAAPPPSQPPPSSQSSANIGDVKPSGDPQQSLPRIPLVVGIPPGAKEAAQSSRQKNLPGSIESLLDTPPIAHHQGKLYLSPKVFGHLTSEQLRSIESLGAQQALQVLQTYLVSHLKERLKKPANKAEGRPPPHAPPADPTVASVEKHPSEPISGQTEEQSKSTPESKTRITRGESVYDQRLEAPKVPNIPTLSATSPTSASTQTPILSRNSAAEFVSKQGASASSAGPSQEAPDSARTKPIHSAARSPVVPRQPTIPSNTTTASSESSSDPLAALSALATHPEAAGLMALLQKQQSGANNGTVKLTPGQLELLQLANRLAIQKKKKATASSASPTNTTTTNNTTSSTNPNLDGHSSTKSADP